ncbi:MAG: PilN domain-containing protein [Cyanobium sp.]
MKGFLARLNQPLTLPKLNQPLKLPKLPKLTLGRKRNPSGGSEAEPPDNDAPGPPGVLSALPAGAAPPLDLLREWREELEVEPLSGLLVLRPVLLRRGVIWGGLMVGASLGLCGVLVLWQQMLRARMAELERYEAQVQQLSQELMGHRAALKAVKEGNDQLVKRLIDVRSSSALLADLQQRVPEGVQLSKVAMEGTDGIKVEGLARDPVAFGRVNALELVLRQSPLLAATEVKLGKATREAPKAVQVKEVPGHKANPTVKLELPSAVTFQLAAKLTPLDASRLVNVMEGLKAEGMVKRLQVLERGGLLP